MMKEETNKNKNRRNWYRANHALIIVGMLVALVLINAFVGALSARVPMSVDVTKNKLYELSSATKGVLSDLKSDVTVYHVTRTGSEVSAVTEVLERYTRASSHVKVQTVDYVKDPNFLSKYTAAQISDNSLIVECGENNTVLDYNQMFDYGYNQNTATSYQSAFSMESRLTNAILQVTQGGEIKVYYITGHGEQGADAQISAMEQENITVAELNLVTEDVPADASALWINVPTRDLGGEELAKIDAFIASGGKVQVVLDPSYHPEGLVSYLAEWGIHVKNDMVGETDASRVLENNPFYFLVAVADHEITSFLTNVNVVAYKASSIELEEVDKAAFSPILASGNTAVSVEEDASGEALPAAQGQKFIGVLSEDMASGGSVSVVSSAYVFGTEALNSGNMGNRALFTGWVKYLTGGNLSGISVESKSLETPRIIMSTTTQRMMSILSIFLLPVIIFGIGIYVWLKRRHL